MWRIQSPRPTLFMTTELSFLKLILYFISINWDNKMLKRGVYAASLSVLNKDLTLNVEATISHGENLIKNGLHGCFFFGSTGMSQLISKSEKWSWFQKFLPINLKKQFFLGTGCNSLNENIELIKYVEYNFNTILLMPSAYYIGNSIKEFLNFIKE